MLKIQNHNKLFSMLGSLAWIIGALFYAFDFLVRTSTNALATYFIHGLKLSAIEVSFIGSIFYWFYLIAQIPAGILVDKVGVKKIMLIATCLLALGTLLFSFSTQLLTLSLARAIMGFAGGFAFVCALKLASDNFPHRLFPLFAGLTQLLGYLGAAASGAPLILVLKNHSWQMVFYYLSLVGFILFIATFLLIRQSKNPIEKPIKSTNLTFNHLLKQLIVLCKQPQMLINGVYCTFMMGATSVFSALWGINYLTHVKHLPTSVAASASSLVFIGVALASPFWGSVASLLNSNKIPLVFAAIFAAINTTLLLYVNINIPLLYITSFLFGAFQSAHVLNFTIIQRITERRYLGTAVAFLNLFTVAGGAILQQLAGFIIENSNHSLHPNYTATNYQHGLIIIPIVQIIAFLLAICITEKKHSVYK